MASHLVVCDIARSCKDHRHQSGEVIKVTVATSSINHHRSLSIQIESVTYVLLQYHSWAAVRPSDEGLSAKVSQFFFEFVWTMLRYVLTMLGHVLIMFGQNSTMLKHVLTMLGHVRQALTL